MNLDEVSMKAQFLFCTILSANLFTICSHLALQGLGQRVSVDGARRAMQRGLLRTGRTDHLREN